MTLTPLAVAVLALLNERPMHPYEMYQTFLERSQDQFVKVRPGSVYHTVERLTRAKLVVSTGTEREGNRPERTTYEITPAGRDAMRERITVMLTHPVNEFPRFPLALSEAHNLSPGEVAGAITAYVGALDETIAALDAGLASACSRDLPEIYWIEGSFVRAQRVAERDWLTTFLHRLETKDIPWPPAP